MQRILSNQKNLLKPFKYNELWTYFEYELYAFILTAQILSLRFK